MTSNLLASNTPSVVRDAFVERFPVPSAKTSSNLNNLICVPNGNENTRIASTLKLLQEAKENLRDTPKNEELNFKILAAVACQGDYLSATNTKDEGVFTELLELTATVRRMGSPFGLIHSSAAYIQMMICYVAFDMFGDIQWVHRGIDFGKDAARALRSQQEAWINVSTPARYRLLYSGRCEKIALGYQTLFAHDNNLNSITAALNWQSDATGWTEPTDGMGGDVQEWGQKLQRFSVWVDIWLKAMEKDPKLSLVEPINLLKAIYPQNLQGGAEQRRAYLLGLHLFCRHWALTRTLDTYNFMLNRVRAIMEWNLNSKYYPLFLENKWYQNPKDQRHLLRAATHIFSDHYSLWDEQSFYFSDLATIKTVIALLEQVYWGYTGDRQKLTWGDLEACAEPLTALCSWYDRKFKLTDAVSDGWRYDDLLFESGWVGVFLKVMSSNGSFSSETLVEPTFLAFESMYLGKSVVTGREYMAFTLKGRVEFSWKSVRMKFVQASQNPQRPLAVEDWISGRTAEGLWIVGQFVDGRDDDVLDFVRNYNARYRAYEVDAGNVADFLQGTAVKRRASAGANKFPMGKGDP